MVGAFIGSLFFVVAIGFPVLSIGIIAIEVGSISDKATNKNFATNESTFTHSKEQGCREVV